MAVSLRVMVTASFAALMLVCCGSDDDDDVACSDVPVAECASRTDCMSIIGGRFAETTNCAAESATIQCVDDVVCGASFTNAVDPQGRCWQFSTTCTPTLEGWRSANADECPDNFAGTGC